MFEGLLCDLDGTLVDSEPLHAEAWLSLLREDYGLDFDDHWFEQWVGTSDRALANHVITTYNIDLAERGLIRQKQARSHERIRADLRLFPGVGEWLGRIARKYPLAIATNSGRTDADVMIAATGLDRFTGVSATATEVDRMKPAPDIYLLAAERLGLSATDCIAIEDSGPGGAAALAAGCHVIGITDKVAGAHERAGDTAAALARTWALLEGS